MRCNGQFFALVSVFMLLAGSATPAGAKVPSTMEVPQVKDSVTAYVPGARVSGAGSLRLLGFHIYDARLFVGSRGLNSDLAADRPYALDLRYPRSFRGADIARRTRKEMERLNLASDQSRKTWEAILSDVFPDVKPGDHLTGVYRPGRGTLFLHNGKPVGEVAGTEFARSFFAIWLHPETREPSLRAALLSGARETGQP